MRPKQAATHAFLFICILSTACAQRDKEANYAAKEVGDTGVAAGTDATSQAGTPIFRYDQARGGCFDEQGVAGLNPLDVERLFGATPGANNQVYAGVDASCVDFRDFNFNMVVGFGYPKLLQWNLAGADLSGAQCFFTHIVDADLSGAKLASLDFGYTKIKGVIDEHTTFGEHCASTEPNTIECLR